MSQIKTTPIEQVILNVQTITYLSNRLEKLLLSFQGIKEPSESTQERIRIIEEKLTETAIETEKLRDGIVEFLGSIDALDELDISLIQPVVNATKLK
jgi:hypothetical protein